MANEKMASPGEPDRDHRFPEILAGEGDASARRGRCRSQMNDAVSVARPTQRAPHAKRVISWSAIGALDYGDVLG